MACHICIYWTPTHGCAHYGPESDVNQISFPRKTQPANGEIVMGYDEDNKIWVKVSYREDSNRFFDEPYTGAVYPILRMSKYKCYDEDNR